MRLYVIASHKPWNADLGDRLQKRTGQQFITITFPEDLTEEKLAELKPRPECIFFAHWSCKVPREIWQNYESIIFHMTDVPYGRGGSPLQNLVIRGHKTTMVSALRCVEELDAGAVYLKKPLSLTGSAQEIYYRADQIIEEMIVEIIKTRPFPQEQNGEPVIFKRRKPEESNLINAQSVEDAYNMIRMLDAEGYPHAFLDTGNLNIEFREARQQEGYIEAQVRIKERP